MFLTEQRDTRRPVIVLVRSLAWALVCLAVFLLPFGAASGSLAAQMPDLGINMDEYGLPPRSDGKARPATPKPGTVKRPEKLRPDRLFGMLEVKSRIKNMPKWERVLRAFKDRKGIDESFGPTRKREAKAWEELKAKYAGAGDLEKAKAVNAFFNQWPYRTDMAQYGVVDYWATPDEFIKNSGDCEDYAITKMYALLQLGVSPNNMRVVALKDTLRNLDHAVMALYANDTVYILDNVARMVMTHENFMHYRPYYSINGMFRWTHVPPR